MHHAGGVFRLLHTQHHACENDRDHVGREARRYSTSCPPGSHRGREDQDHTDDTGKQGRGDEGLAEKRYLKTDDSADDQQNADDGNIVKKVTEGSARDFSTGIMEFSPLYYFLCISNNIRDTVKRRIVSDLPKTTEWPILQGPDTSEEAPPVSDNLMRFVILFSHTKEKKSFFLHYSKEYFYFSREKNFSTFCYSILPAF